MQSEIFTGKDLINAFDAGVDAVALECNKRVISVDKCTASADYIQGYKDALGELLEYIEFDMEKM